MLIISNKQLVDEKRNIDVVIAKDPSHVFALSNRGVALFNTKQYARAVADLEQALALAPADWRLRGTYASALKKAQDQLAAGR